MPSIAPWKTTSTSLEFQATAPVFRKTHEALKPDPVGKVVKSAGCCETRTHCSPEGGAVGKEVGGRGGAATTGTLAALAVITQLADTQATPELIRLTGTFTCHQFPSSLLPMILP
jgi:hypothetical protein